MIVARIKNGFLDFDNTNFNCKCCNKQYNDNDNKFVERCNKNKKSKTKIKCDCGNVFFVTYNYIGECVTI